MIINMDDAQRQAISNLLHQSQNHSLQQLNYLQQQQQLIATSLANSNQQNQSSTSSNEMKQQQQAAIDHQFAIQRHQQLNSFASLQASSNAVTPSINLINNNNNNNINNNNNNNHINIINNCNNISNNTKLNNLAAAAAAVVAGDQRSNAESQSPNDNIGSQSVSSRSHLSTSSTPTSASSPFNNNNNNNNHMNNLQVNRQNHQQNLVNQHQMNNNLNNNINNNKQMHHQLNQFAIHPAHQQQQTGINTQPNNIHLPHQIPPHLYTPQQQQPPRLFSQQVTPLPIGLANGHMIGAQCLTRMGLPPAHSGGLNNHQPVNHNHQQRLTPPSTVNNNTNGSITNTPPTNSSSSHLNNNVPSSQRVLPPPPNTRSSPFAPYPGMLNHHTNNQPSRPSSATGRALNTPVQGQFNLNNQPHQNNNFAHSAHVPSNLSLISAAHQAVTLSPPLSRPQPPAAHQNSSKPNVNIAHDFKPGNHMIHHPFAPGTPPQPIAAHQSSKIPNIPGRIHSLDIFPSIIPPINILNNHPMPALSSNNISYLPAFPLSMAPPNSVPHPNSRMERRSPSLDPHSSFGNKQNTQPLDSTVGHQVQTLASLKQQELLNQRSSADMQANVNKQRNLQINNNINNISNNNNNNNNNALHTNNLINAIYPNILNHNVDGTITTGAQTTATSSQSSSISDPHSSLISPLNNAAFLSTLANGPQASAMFRLAHPGVGGPLQLIRPNANTSSLVSNANYAPPFISSTASSTIAPINSYVAAGTGNKQSQIQSNANDPYKFSEQTSALITSPGSLSHNENTSVHLSKHPLNMASYQNPSIGSKTNTQSTLSGPLATMSNMAGNITSLKNAPLMNQNQDNSGSDISKLPVNTSSSSVVRQSKHQQGNKKAKLSPRINDNPVIDRDSPPNNKHGGSDGQLIDGSNKINPLLNTSEIHDIILNTIDNTTSETPLSSSSSLSNSKVAPITSTTINSLEMNSTISPMASMGDCVISDLSDKINCGQNITGNEIKKPNTAQANLVESTYHLPINTHHDETPLPVNSNTTSMPVYTTASFADSVIAQQNNVSALATTRVQDLNTKNDELIAGQVNKTQESNNLLQDTSNTKQLLPHDAFNIKSDTDSSKIDPDNPSDELIKKNLNENNNINQVNHTTNNTSLNSSPSTDSPSKYQKFHTKKAWLKNYDQEDQARVQKEIHSTNIDSPIKVEVLDQPGDNIISENNDKNNLDQQEQNQSDTMEAVKNDDKQENDKNIRRMPRRKVKPNVKKEHEDLKEQNGGTRIKNSERGINPSSIKKENKALKSRKQKEKVSKEKTTTTKHRHLSDEPFLQKCPCYIIVPKNIRCLECRRVRQPSVKNDKQASNTSGAVEKTTKKGKVKWDDFCRFYEFRKLRRKQDEIFVAGFSDCRDVTDHDKALWIPSNEKRNIIDYEVAKFIIDKIGNDFCSLVMQERNVKQQYELMMKSENEDLKSKNVIWKRTVNGLRELCDVCSTTLFNFHYVCERCGFVVCIDCHALKFTKLEISKGNAIEPMEIENQDDKNLIIDTIDNGEDSNSKVPTLDGKTSSDNNNESQLVTPGKKNKKDLSGWLFCAKNLEHAPDKMTLAQIIAGDCLEDVWTLLHAVRERLGLTTCVCKENPMLDDSPRPMEIDDMLMNDHDIENLNPSTKSEDSDKISSEDVNNLHDMQVRDAIQGCIEDCLSSLSDLDKNLASNKFEILAKPKISESLPVSSYLCNGDLLVLEQPNHHDNVKLFRAHWPTGKPVLVRGIHKNLNMEHWMPQYFAKEFGDYRSDLVDCRNGDIHRHSMKKYWDGFEPAQTNAGSKKKSTKDESFPSANNEGLSIGQPIYYSGSPLWRLKDWPPGQDFKDILPSHYEDFMYNLPLTQYTTRMGDLNLACRLPSEMLMPDLGPKMYCAYGTAEFPERGTTNLHLDISDAINVMIYVGGATAFANGSNEVKSNYERAIDNCKLDSKMTMEIKNKKLIPGALWHIFKPSDVSKIRKFLNEVAEKRNISPNGRTDPIHDQTWYLDQALLDDLEDRYGVKSYPILQCMGDAVLIPAGAPHQVKNVQNCIKVANDFVSPENVRYCLALTDEFRNLPETHMNQEDKLQIKNILYHSVKDSLEVIQAHDRESVDGEEMLNE